MSIYMYLVCVYGSMRIGEHQRSDRVRFYPLGLGGRERLTEDDWRVRTLTDIARDLGDGEVSGTTPGSLCTRERQG